MREHYDDRMDEWVEEEYDEGLDRHTLEAEEETTMNLERETEKGLRAAAPEPRMTEALRTALDDHALEHVNTWGTPAPGPGEVRYWITRDGRAMLISEMDNDHLRNTIRFVERNEEDYRLHVFMSTYVNIPEWMQPRGDGAQMAFDQGVEESATRPLEDVFPPYRWLLDEAKERGL